MFRIAICDPSEEGRHQIADYIARDTEIEDDYIVKGFSSVTDVKQCIDQKAFGYDLLFLYIGEDAADSLRLAAQLREQHMDVDIWFMADSGAYVHDAFRHRAINYVKKPISYARFAQEMHQYIASIRKDQKEILVVQIKGRDQVIPLRAVVYFSSDARKVGAFFSQDDREIWFYDKLDQLEKKLLPYGFIRTHQSYLVNGRRIERLEGDSVVTSEGSFPVSRRYLPSVRERMTVLMQERAGGVADTSDWSDAKTVIDEPEESTGHRVYGVVIGVRGCGNQAQRIYHDETISVGRDTSRCQMVVDDTKVSRMHCQIRFDEKNQCYHVKDSSTNGTFSMTSGRFPAEKWVQMGRDSILHLSGAGCALWLE